MSQQNAKLAETTETEETPKKNLTVFGQETEFDGTLEFTDNLIITGKFKGSIKSTGELEIDKSAICEVDDIVVNSVVISGRVKGNIEAKERIEMCSGSKVSGDIVTARLRIADDVDFDGQVKMLDKEIDTDLFTTSSEEYKQALIVKSDMPH